MRKTVKPAQQPEPFDAFNQLLPSAEDAERWAISCCLESERLLREYMGVLQSDHFVSERHRIVWDSMRRLYEADIPVKYNTLIDDLRKTPGRFEAAGGFAYTLEFTDHQNSVPVPSTMWIKPILETFARRRLMFKCNESLIRLTDRNESPSSIAQELEEGARECAAIAEPSSGFSSLADVIRECGGIDAFLARGSEDTVPYPWDSLNSMTNGGMRPGQVIVIGGPSGMGKTTLALNIAFGACRVGVPVIFSLEMDSKEIHGKLLSLAAAVDSYHFHRPDESERRRLSEARRILNENEIMVEDGDSVSVSAMKAKVKKLMGTTSVSMVIVDYIQLVEGRRKSQGESREQEISGIMRGLKRMARELKLPVVALTQILEDAGAGTREPELKDCRESRSIGHTANLVGFLFFTRRYDIAAGVPTGDLDFIVRKQRGGPEGRIRLRFNAPTGSFYEYQ